MYTVYPQFHRLVTDGETPQVLLLVEGNESGTLGGNVYLSSDGDMSSDGATFVEEMTSSEDYRLGCVPSKAMTVSIMNRNGYLNGHNFGWLRAFIGVRYVHTALSYSSGTYFEVVYQGESQDWDGTYRGDTTGFYKDNTCIHLGSINAMLTFGDGVMYIFDASTLGSPVKVYAVDLDTLAVEDATLPTFICEKMRSARVIDVEKHAGTWWLFTQDGNYADAYYLCPLGAYGVNRPKKTLGDSVEIVDALDRMHNLDMDATPILDGATITDGKALILALCGECGLSVTYSSSEIQSRLEGIFVNLKDLLNNSYTCRRLVSYLCEAVGCNARLKNEALYLYEPSGETATKAYPIYANRVLMSGLETQEYTTSAVDAIAVKSLSGDTKLYPAYGSSNIYEFSGNPFVDEATATLLSYTMQIPTYEPLTAEILEADPSFQNGDIAVISTFDDETELATYEDDMGSENIIQTYSGDDIVVVPSTGKYVFPIMSQTITWNGKTSATYEATGTDNRTGEGFDSYSDTNARSSKYISADYISGGTIRGINIIGTHITGESTVAGAEIIGSKITGGQSITYYGDDYSDADIQRIGAIILEQVTPTAEDYERLDVNKDGEFNIVDIAIIQDAMRDGTCVVDLTLTIDPDRTSDQIIKLGNTTIGVDSMKTTRLNVLGEATVGSLSADGGVGGSSFTVNGHSTPIGSTLSSALSSAMSIPAQTDEATEVLSLEVPAGTWIMYGSARFAARSTAARQLVTISTVSAHYASAYRADTYSLAGQMSQVQCIAIVTPTTFTTYYLNVSSTVATSVAATATAIRAIRIL